MNLDPAAISVSRRRATRVRTRVVFFLLRRALRRLQRGAKGGTVGAISRLFGQGPRALRLEPRTAHVRGTAALFGREVFLSNTASQVKRRR